MTSAVSEGRERLWQFVRERHMIYLRRTAGEPWPWTQDPILQRFRFCNCYRELDTVTAWLRQNWYIPHAGDPDLWFAAAVARHLNLPAALEELGWPLPWDPERFRSTVRRRISNGQRAYSAAYLIRASRENGGQKEDYLVDRVLTPMWEAREELRPRWGEDLHDFWLRLCGQFGVASFMAGQVVADAKFHGRLKGSQDWWVFAPPGPGSQRGLNYVLGRPPGQMWRLDDWRVQIESTRIFLNLRASRYAETSGWPMISGQDTQNCLCEHSRYEKTRLNQGRPKQLFRHT